MKAITIMLQNGTVFFRFGGHTKAAKMQDAKALQQKIMPDGFLP